MQENPQQACLRRPKRTAEAVDCIPLQATMFASMQMTSQPRPRGQGTGFSKSKTVDTHGGFNQIGELGAGRLKTFKPPAVGRRGSPPRRGRQIGLRFFDQHWAYDNGRSAGSVAWAGIFNTFWLDPIRSLRHRRHHHDAVPALLSIKKPWACWGISSAQCTRTCRS